MQALEESPEFFEKTDTFDITVTLQDDKLLIILKDFVDWAIYSKQYTEGDIGKQINHKMNLTDIFQAFSQTKRDDDQRIKKNQGEISRLKHYQFGTIVEHEGIPCYNIEKDGKITVYFDIIERKSKRLKTYESKLTLTKLKNMTETEIKFEKEKINKTLEKQKQESYELLKRVMMLEKANLKLQEQLRTTKQQVQFQYGDVKQELRVFKEETDAKNGRFEDKITLLNQKESRFQERIIQTGQQFHETTQKLEQKMKRADQWLEQRINRQIYEASKQLAQKNEQLEEKLTQIKEQFKIQRRNKSRNQSRPLINKKNLSQPKRKSLGKSSAKMNLIQIQKIHSLPHASRKYFRIVQNYARYQGEWFNTQYMFNQKIKDKKLANFKIKINSRTRKKMIGIVDYAKQKDTMSSYNSGNAMCYSGQGLKYPEGIKEGNRFYGVEVVEVDVDRVNCIVYYSVKGIMRASQRNNILGDANRIFVPYVEMYTTGDSVAWVM